MKYSKFHLISKAARNLITMYLDLMPSLDSMLSFDLLYKSMHGLLLDQIDL